MLPRRRAPKENALDLRMTGAEREAFLAGVHVGVLSMRSPAAARSRRRSGTATSLAEGSGLTGRDSRKGRLLASGVRVGFVAQSEEVPYRYVSVEGPVVSAERRAAEPNVLVRIRPERWLSVDYRKTSING